MTPDKIMQELNKHFPPIDSKQHSIMTDGARLVIILWRGREWYLPVIIEGEHTAEEICRCIADEVEVMNLPS